MYQQGSLNFDTPVAERTPDRYHNTIPLSGDELKAREMKAESQGRKILDFFRLRPHQSFTPFEVLRLIGFERVPVTSIRRSLTNLTQCLEHYLIVTGEKRPGDFGDPNNCWALNTAASQHSYIMTFDEKEKNLHSDTVI